MGNHALLSASSSHRWLNCPPSARLGENYEDKGSDFAAEGTDAHSLCEHKLKTALGIPSEDSTENLTWYNEEMEECASGYAAYVLELLAEAKKVTTDPIVLIEQRLDYSKYVESGFGTGDCVLIADGTLNIVDYKHGKGVEVSADHNPQMMLYEERLDTMARLKQELDLKIAACAAKRVQITGFLNELMKHDAPLAKFDPLVWQAVINYATVNRDCTITFTFRDGTEKTVPIKNGVRPYTKRNKPQEVDGNDG